MKRPRRKAFALRRTLALRVQTAWHMHCLRFFYFLDTIKANVHDVHYPQDVKEQLSDCTILGDKGYLSAAQQLDLFESANILLETSMRTNQKGYKSNRIFLGIQGKGSKPFSPSYATSSRSGEIIPKPLAGSKQEYWPK